MRDEELISSQLSLLNAHRQRLSVRLEQRALVGLAHVSPEVVIDILDARKAIRNIKTSLKERGVDVPWYEMDEELVPTNDVSPSLPLTNLLWPDGSILVLIPVRLESGNALFLGKHPITNKQYKRFIEATHEPAPIGEHYRRGKWSGPFDPWSDPNFSGDDQPVVCVNQYSASVYCQWVNKLVMQHNRAVMTKQDNAPNYRLPKSITRLPKPIEWDYAAYGTAYPTFTPNWFTCQKEIIHSTYSTEPIDLLDMRTTPFGVSDMLGQVWEWCDYDDRLSGAVLGVDEGGEVKGGAFLDNLFNFRALPSLNVYEITNGPNTQHSDLGFRIAVEVSFADLSEDEQAKIATFPSILYYSDLL